VYSEGVIFVAANVGGNGRIAAIDPRNGRQVFAPGATGYDGSMNSDPDRASVPNSTPGLPPVISTPTVGYVRDTTTGAVDKMVYAYFDFPSVGGSANNTR